MREDAEVALGMMRGSREDLGGLVAHVSSRTWLANYLIGLVCRLSGKRSVWLRGRSTTAHES